jgi:hypothetical protein
VTPVTIAAADTDEMLQMHLFASSVATNKLDYTWGGGRLRISRATLR